MTHYAARTTYTSDGRLRSVNAISTWRLQTLHPRASPLSVRIRRFAMVTAGREVLARMLPERMAARARTGER
jgi:hypothetical protein